MKVTATRIVRNLSIISLLISSFVITEAHSRRVSATQSSSTSKDGSAIDERLFNAMRWRQVGPFRGGRVLAVTGVPGEPNLFYFGAASGGVWKTTDAGASWAPIFDNERIASIGSIAV